VIAKNRLTQYVVAASAYTAVLRSIDLVVKTLMVAHPEMFSANKTHDVMVEIRDFQTALHGSPASVRITSPRCSIL
jgi:hypothetical protein